MNLSVIFTLLLLLGLHLHLAEMSGSLAAKRSSVLTSTAV